MLSYYLCKQFFGTQCCFKPNPKTTLTCFNIPEIWGIRHAISPSGIAAVSPFKVAPLPKFLIRCCCVEKPGGQGYVERETPPSLCPSLVYLLLHPSYSMVQIIFPSEPHSEYLQKWNPENHCLFLSTWRGLSNWGLSTFKVSQTHTLSSHGSLWALKVGIHQWHWSLYFP